MMSMASPAKPQAKQWILFVTWLMDADGFVSSCDPDWQRIFCQRPRGGGSCQS